MLTPHLASLIADPDNRCDLGRNPALSREVIARLVDDDPASSFVMYAASHPNTPADCMRRIYDRFGDDLMDCVSAGSLAENPSLPEDVALRLAVNHGAVYAKDLARNPALSPALRAVVARDGEEGVLYAAAVVAYDDALRATDAAELTQIAGGAVAFRRFAARAANVDAVTLATLATDEDDSVRRAVAFHSRSSTVTLARLADDPSAVVRRIVAGNPATLESTLADLSTDPADSVRAAVARNPSTAASVVRQLLKAPPGDNVRLAAHDWPGWSAADLDAFPCDMPAEAAAVCEHPNVSAATLRRHAGHDSVEVRAAVADAAAVPLDVLDDLASEGSARLNGVMLRNPALAEHITVQSVTVQPAMSGPSL